jgi:hypothetical protein
VFSGYLLYSMKGIVYIGYRQARGRGGEGRGGGCDGLWRKLDENLFAAPGITYDGRTNTPSTLVYQEAA